MSVYAKKVETTDQRFTGRATVIEAFSRRNEKTVVIPVPDTLVICNGCNKNLYPDQGYLVYLGKRELAKDQPYDLYCEKCLKDYFKGYKEVS